MDGESIDVYEQQDQDKLRFDYKRIELFGKTGLPVEDMAAVLGVQELWIHRLMENPKSKFYRCYRRGQALTKLSLLRSQIATACGDAKGNPSLLMHLGVIMLGQQPTGKKQTEEQENTAEKVMQNVPAAQKEQMYNAMIGITEPEIEVYDEDKRR
jgi:hypothetical protein